MVCRRCLAVPADAAIHLDFLQAGLTYRQLDYWTRRGYLLTIRPDCGSGHRRAWASEEITVARRILELIRQGRTVASAALQARDELS